MSKLAYDFQSTFNSHEQVELFEIAHQMKQENLDDNFIAAAVNTALKYEGVADLLKLWREENEPSERDEIIADIQDLIDDCNLKKNRGISLYKDERS